MAMTNNETTFKKRMIWTASMLLTLVVAVAGFNLIEKYSSVETIQENIEIIRTVFGYCCLALLGYTGLNSYLEWNKELQS